MWSGRTLVRCGVTALIAAGLLVAPTPAAVAAVAGLVRIAPFTVQDSSAKTLTATCPPGTRVLGAGGDTSPGQGRVLLDDIRPNADLTAVILHADEVETGTTDTWFLQASVVCALAPAGLLRIEAASASTSAAKSVTATCPSGKRLLGSGAEIVGANRQVLLDGLLPNPGLTSVTVNAVEDSTGTTAAWTLKAFAICAAPVFGLQRVAVTGASDSLFSKVVTAPCPGGRGLLGMGGTLNGGADQIVLDAMYADADAGTAGFSGFESVADHASDWSLTAYAICASRTELASSASGRRTAAGIGHGVSCPNGRTASGAGGDLTGAFGRVGLLALIPDATGVSVSAYAHPAANVANWGVTAQAICSTPYPGQEVVRATGPFDSAAQKSVTVTCPAGKRVIGAGGGGSPDQFTIDGLVLDMVRPAADLSSVTATIHEEEAGRSGGWSVSAYAVCASGTSGLARVVATGLPGTDEFSQVSAICPAGKQLTGTGAEIVGGLGEVMLDEIGADLALTRTKVTAFEDSTGFGPDWSVTAYAICLDR